MAHPCRIKNSTVTKRIVTLLIREDAKNTPLTGRSSCRVTCNLPLRKDHSWMDYVIAITKIKYGFCLVILFMGFSRQEYSSGLPFPSPGDHVLSACRHEIKRRLLIGRKVMTNLDNILKSRDITLLTKVHLVKATVFPVVMYGCKSCTLKKAEHFWTESWAHFEVWC